MIKIRINATKQVRYTKLIEVDEAAWIEYQAAVERDEDDIWFSAWADRCLDFYDAVDDSEFEDVDAEVVSDG